MAEKKGRIRIKVKFEDHGDWVKVIVANQMGGVMVHRSMLPLLILNFRIYETEPRIRKLEN